MFVLKISLVFLASFVSLSLCTAPIAVILDTDIGEYPDDVGAFALLHSYADQGLIELKATIASNAYEGIVPVMEAMNVYFNRSHIPIGITRDRKAFSSKGNLTWAQRVIEHYPHPSYQINAQAQEGVDLYRQVLAKAGDNSTTILSIGHFTNLANLLDSQADVHSPLAGAQLVARKVSRVIAMAGNFPTGFEWNIFQDLHAAQRFVKQWPVMPILFAGFELSNERILCGRGLLKRDDLDNSPVKMAIQVGSSIPEHFDGCYDELAAFVMVENYDKYFDTVNGRLEVLDNGTNIWHATQPNDASSYMAYLRVKDTRNDLDLLNHIEMLMAR